MGKKSVGSWLIKMLGLIPYVVSGIEQIHGEELRGADKKQLAMDALGLSATTAMVLDPGQSDAISAAAQLASAAIDGVKAVYNATRKAAVIPPAPGPVAVGKAPAPETPGGFPYPSGT